MCSDILIKFWETFWPTGRGGGGGWKKISGHYFIIFFLFKVQLLNIIWLNIP
jgi:hypothetical protein